MTRALIFLLTLLLLALAGCKQSSDQPAARPETPEPTEIPGLSLCTDPRPEVCTQNYAPVCGVHEDGSRRTYSNGCMACSNAEVVGSLPGACPK